MMKIKNFISVYSRYSMFILLLILCSCIKNEMISTNQEEIDLQTTDIPQDPLRERAVELAASMDEGTLVAQLFITGIDGRGTLPNHMIKLLEEIPAGGVMLFRNNVNTDNESIRSLIAKTASLITETAGIAPFIAVDLEGGSVNRFTGNKDMPAASSLPSAAFYRERAREWLEKNTREGIPVIDEIYKDAYAAAKEIAALGINMNFAPVAEVLNEDNRDFLFDRSYGDDQFFVSEAASAFLYGMKEAGVLCVPKHYPGSAGKDPHYTASVMNHYPQYDFPFDALFSRGARAVMAAHTLIPAVDDKIASLSPVIMNHLREYFGFTGIIIADDFSMAAAAIEGVSPELAAVFSVAAGADMILVWQHNLKRTYEVFINALEDGTLPKERLRKAVENIIYEKLKMELIE